MAYDKVVIVDGIRAIVRFSGRRPKACACGKPGEYLCDWILIRAGVGGRKRDKRCSQPVCRTHAEEVAEDKHLCPAHAEAYRAWLDRQRARPSPSPAQIQRSLPLPAAEPPGS